MSKEPKGKRRLGRGLEAILGDRDDEAGVIRDLPVEQIRPNPNQPRRAFAEQSLQELADSIRVHGVLQPLIVVAEESGYTLVAGERRWRAARLAGLDRVPAIVRELADVQRTELALIENLQREDLTPIEEARAYQTLHELFDLTQEAIAQRVGKSRSQIANTMRLLALDPAVQKDVDQGTLSVGHAKLLLSVARSEDQRRLARLTVERGWTVRQLADQLQGGPRRVTRGRARRRQAPSRPADPHWQAAAEALQRALGTRVEIVPDGEGRGGRIVLEFYGAEEFERLFAILARTAQVGSAGLQTAKIRP